MIILGIQEAHDASAALMIDGEIVAAAQEERFTGLKGDYGFPKKAIEACFKSAGVNSSQLNEVALASHNWNPVLTKIKRNANFSVDDWVKEQREYWKPTLLEKKRVVYYELFKDRADFKYDEIYPMDHLLTGYMDEPEMREMAELRKKTLAKLLGVSEKIVNTITHEDCHTFYSYFASDMREKVLALTTEGIGDYSNGTVSIFSENGRRELASTKENHIGHIYQYVTLLLGMKPNQHEYKVMGLAPYSNIKEKVKSLDVFKTVLKVDGLNIVYDRKPKDLYFTFKRALEGHRFDGIAGALQQWVEGLLREWTKKCISKTRIGKICFSGGVAQNIKAVKAMMELEEVNDIFVPPAAGDTSLSIGACYYTMWKHIKETRQSFSKLHALDNIYLGPEYSDEEIEKTLEKNGVRSRYRVIEGVTQADVARQISDGMIIARCTGRMEFGLRALGNRSILADPRRLETVQRINSAIKFRDFWMPFTPTILAERAYDYIINPKHMQSPFMTMAFESTTLARKELRAALHPADLTVRPQILEEWRNPDYYSLIKEFEKVTGVGGILNTSFNLHGFPIVLGPKEALYTFDNSELDGLLLNDYLIRRD